MRGGENKKNKDLKKATPVLAVLIIAAMLCLWMVSYNLVTKQVIKTSVSSIEELAKHDERSIMEDLYSRWEAMEGIVQDLRERDRGSVEEVSKSLSSFARMMDWLRLTLVAEDGSVLVSGETEDSNLALLEVCKSSGTKFIRRRVDADNASPYVFVENLQAGIKMDPLLVGDKEYTYLVARMHINTLESMLKIDSYGGLGYSSVIDTDGSYIVNIDRGETNHLANNFFEYLGACTLPDDYPLERVRSLIESQTPFSMEYKRASGEVCMMVFDPLKEIDWYFVTVVPRAVFEEQSMSLIRIFMSLMGVVLVGMALVVIYFFRRRAKLYDMEQEHRKELADALALAEQASRAKTTFLNNMSHDIRTPMNAIIGYTALASTHIDNKERVRDYLGKITQSSSHLLSLINDVLDMSRIESGKMNVEEKPENIAEILHNLRNIVQADIHAKQLEFFIDTVDVSDEDILCDKLRLNQVLLNILSNAIKFTAPGGFVSMRITQKSVKRTGYGSYEFRIKDSGIGMSHDFIKTIFEPFTRERTATVSGVQGTGLGMSITKNIVDMMGGDIKVESEEGKGSEFIVTLDFKLQGRHNEIEVVKSLEGLRGLVVDDDMNACQSVAQMLRQIGMRSEWTMYGKEAVARTKEALKIGDAFSVYIIDWLMPDMNGIETVRRIRREVGDEAPIIILSAYDWADIEDEAKEAGVTDFISKPLFPSDLRRVLMKACGELVDEEPKLEIDKKFSNIRLLLVEDNELNLEIAQEILQDNGFTVELAHNGEEAVEAVKNAEPEYYDAVLMDIQMPVMDGYEATRLIRDLDDSARANVPIIAMTANAFEEDRQNAEKAGMNGHVSKPIDVNILLGILAKQLRINGKV